MPHILILSPWIYGFYNIATFRKFEVVIAQEQVLVRNRWSIMNSNITVLHVLSKATIKAHITLYAPYYI